MICRQKRIPRTNSFIGSPIWGNLISDFYNNPIKENLGSGPSPNISRPLTNMVEFKDRYILDVALPGFTKDDVEIDVDNGILMITSNKSDKKEAKNFRLREFDYAHFKKTYKLPEAVNPNTIKASFNQGILTIVLNKKEEAIPQPSRKIEIL